ncbi:MAG: UvrD-helicase domain-containing protein [Clostridia bacterium]|nr:UvrD-helicase domain-containing protein [Clostridia bacterium]
MNFTKAQQAAMNARGQTLLVSAAAGSGKTFTLTQRIIKRIIEEGVDISSLLIVTFTRAAAGELRAKISKALAEAIAEHPDDKHLQRQMLKLGSAHISTIDSFFSDPVRANFEKLGLPASMRLSDKAELSPLQEEVMKEVLEDFFERCGEFSDGNLSSVGYRSLFSDLVGIISVARDSSALIPTLLKIYGKLITAPEGIGQLKKHAERMQRSASLDFLETDEGRIVRAELCSLIRYIASTFEKCCEDMATDPVLREKYIPCFTANAELCRSLLRVTESEGYESVRSAFAAYAPERIPSLKKGESTEISEHYKNLRGKKLNPAIKNGAKELLYAEPDEISSWYEQGAKLCLLIFDILAEYERRYSEEKLSRGLCEFSDMPKFMLRLLQNEDGSPSEYAKSISADFSEVYIDEYQDVNEIQDRIFEIIGGSHRFMVGDIKQSIYGFREAEPSIFAGYRRSFAPYGENAPADRGGSTIFMSNNFRCDENVVKFTNLVCSKIFSAFSESIGYTKDDDLIFSKEKPFEDYQSPKVTVDLIQPAQAEDEEEEDTSASPTSNLYDEAIVVANEIARLIREGKKADGAPIRASDIAVLVRSHSHAKPLIANLNKLNVKCSTSSKSALFDGEEMRLLIDLLSVIDNPRRDVPLCHVLTAALGEADATFSLEEIVVVRHHAPASKSLFDAILDYVGEDVDSSIAKKCYEFASDIKRLREISSKLSADKLLRVIGNHEKYQAACTGEAYTYLYDCACKYVKTSWNGLYAFLSYFKKLIEKGESGAEPAKSDPDSVTIMSIHQSKGLEFNTCFLFGLAKQFSTEDSKSPLLFTKELGISPKLPPREDENSDRLDAIRVRYKNNLLFQSANKLIKRKQLEEEARIFYVALTRARERLYLSATLNKPIPEYFAEIANNADKAYGIRSSKNYVRQTLLALSEYCDCDKDGIFEINAFDKGKNTLVSPLGRSASRSDSAATDEYSKELAILLSQKNAMSDEEKILAMIPAKVAASKISPSMLDDSVFIPIPTGEAFAIGEDDPNGQDRDDAIQIKRRIDLMRSQSVSFDDLLEVNKKPTAAERGTATHLFLQYCDYQYAAENGIDAEIDRLREKRFISNRVADIINRKHLSGFFESELFGFIKNAKKIHREFHFRMFRPAADFTEDERTKKLVSDKKIFVQGSIDLIIESANGELILCDYKTDRISPEQKTDPALLVASMREKHGYQLGEYRHAVEQIFGKSPSKVFIYSVPIGKTVEL